LADFFLVFSELNFLETSKIELTQKDAIYSEKSCQFVIRTHQKSTAKNIPLEIWFWSGFHWQFRLVPVAFSVAVCRDFCNDKLTTSESVSANAYAKNSTVNQQANHTPNK
jgi:hypothetical protein